MQDFSPLVAPTITITWEQRHTTTPIISAPAAVSLMKISREICYLWTPVVSPPRTDITPLANASDQAGPPSGKIAGALLTRRKPRSAASSYKG